MPARIEDYAIIGDCQTTALVSRDGSIDWLCFPRFDSGACFAALLGTPDHGRWQLAPQGAVRSIRRSYRAGTLILETEFHTDDGVVAVIDFMPVRTAAPDLIRIVEGRSGQVQMQMDFVLRFDYGSIVPWVRQTGDGITAIAGPDAMRLHTSVPLRGENFRTVADFSVSAGQQIPFALTWHASNSAEPEPKDAQHALRETEQWWQEWSSRCEYSGEWRDEVLRSLITLKALTYAPTGGIVAAATTSLPEQLGGVRNWDYRFCWLRDATFALQALVNSGYQDEARAWREWLVRAVAGKPSEMQIMYGLAGERRLSEWEVPWLPGYEGAAPVRVGNAAYNQHQLDVYGEVMDAFHLGRRSKLQPEEDTWRVQRALINFLEGDWQNPDEGIWEIRGPRQHFTHSKVMAWVAVDRAVQAVQDYGLHGPLQRWQQLRDTIHADVCANGFDAERNTFVQHYGSKQVDASLLPLPIVGFIPATDPRMLGTVRAIEQDLLQDGFVARYRTSSGVDGLPTGEGAFLVCSFWLVDNLALQGRTEEARALFERLIGLSNDVGLLAEEYDTASKRLVGNFPQAFSHVGLINSARNISQGTMIRSDGVAGNNDG